MAITTAASQDSYTLLEPIYQGAVKVYDVQAGGLSLYITDIVRYFFMLVAVIAAFYLIYGGIQYLTTDMAKLKLDGKETIQRVIVGLIFIFSIWTVFNAINPDLLRSAPDFKTVSGSSSAAGSGSNTGATGGGTSPSNTPISTPVNSGDYPWPTGSQTGNGVVCNGGKKTRSINASACFDNYKDIIEKYSAQYGVDKNIIRTVIFVESSGDPNATRFESSINDTSYGLMQILGNTATGLGCLSGWKTNIDKNIECGTRYLKQGLSRGYTLYDLIARYNGGDGAMTSSRDCPGLKRWQCSFDDTEHKVCNVGFEVSRNYAVVAGDSYKTYQAKSMCSW